MLTTWHPLSAKGDTDSADKRRSLSRYSSLAVSGPGDCSYLSMTSLFCEVMCNCVVNGEETMTISPERLLDYQLGVYDSLHRYSQTVQMSRPWETPFAVESVKRFAWYGYKYSVTSSGHEFLTITSVLDMILHVILGKNQVYTQSCDIINWLFP
jgi:hypothetical protein